MDVIYGRVMSKNAKRYSQTHCIHFVYDFWGPLDLLTSENFNHKYLLNEREIRKTETCPMIFLFNTNTIHKVLGNCYNIDWIFRIWTMLQSPFNQRTINVECTCIVKLFGQKEI